MTKSKAISTIKEAFDDIPDLFDGFSEVKRRLYRMNLESEHKHRRGAPAGITHGISAKLAAKYFTVKYLLDGWAQPDKYSVDDVLNIRNEVIYAQAYAKRHHVELAEWAARYQDVFACKDGKWEIDYVQLMKGVQS